MASAGSSDVAYLYDGAGSNAFVGTSTYSYLTGTGYDNEAVGFKTVVAYDIRRQQRCRLPVPLGSQQRLRPHSRLQLPGRRRLAGRSQWLPDGHRGVRGLECLGLAAVPGKKKNGNRHRPISNDGRFFVSRSHGEPWERRGVRARGGNYGNEKKCRQAPVKCLIQLAVSDSPVKRSSSFWILA